MCIRDSANGEHVVDGCKPDVARVVVKVTDVLGMAVGVPKRVSEHQRCRELRLRRAQVFLRHKLPSQARHAFPCRLILLFRRQAEQAAGVFEAQPSICSMHQVESFDHQRLTVIRDKGPGRRKSAAACNLHAQMLVERHERKTLGTAFDNVTVSRKAYFLEKGLRLRSQELRDHSGNAGNDIGADEVDERNGRVVTVEQAFQLERQWRADHRVGGRNLNPTNGVATHRGQQVERAGSKQRPQLFLEHGEEKPFGQTDLEEGMQRRPAPTLRAYGHDEGDKIILGDVWPIAEDMAESVMAIEHRNRPASDENIELHGLSPAWSRCRSARTSSRVGRAPAETSATSWPSAWARRSNLASEKSVPRPRSKRESAS